MCSCSYGNGRRNGLLLIRQFLEKSSAGTLELLVDQLATHLLPSIPDNSKLNPTIRKPSALPFACPSISISRLKTTGRSPSQSISIEGTGAEETTDLGKRVFIALGSNIGDRVGNIRRAVDGLEKEGVKVVRTGRLYESEPMYVEDQARFINTVIEVRLTPHQHDVRLMDRSRRLWNPCLF